MIPLQGPSSRPCVPLIVALAVACSSDPAPAPPNGGPSDPANPMTMPCGPLNSGYDGDELCILPPDPALGIQLHIGPTDYDDPAQQREFELPPNGELTRCYYLNVPLTETFNFYEQHYRLRPGSHHLIMHMNTDGGAHPDGWDGCEMGGFIPIGGTQRSVSEFPIDGITPPEDENLFRPLLPNTLLKFELHFVNTTNEPILREVWVNFKRKEVKDGDQILGGVFMVGGVTMAIQPHTKETLNYKCPPLTEPKRMVSLFGHRHAHTTRFSAWAHRAGVRELIYEDYDWQEPTELTYNSVVKNPAADPARRKAGGASGILDFAVGDTLEWECEIDNTSDQILRFRNEVYTGEMCNVFGSSVALSTFWSCFNP
jgi:hypothetical protein